jgi:ATP-dependent Lon protease
LFELIEFKETLPLLPIRDLVVYPFMILPLFVGRDSSIKAVEEALNNTDRLILLASQKDISAEHPAPSDIYELGTVAMIMRMRKLPDGRVKILIQGLTKARIMSFESHEPFYKVKVSKVENTVSDNVTLKDQNLMTDFSALPKNISPFNFNALKVDIGLQQKLNDKMTFVTDNQLLISRVGNRVILSTGIIHQNTSLILSYQGGMKSFNIGNSLQSVNLLQNFNQTDGVRLTVGQNFTNRSGSFSGSLSAHGGLSTSTP